MPADTYPALRDGSSSKKTPTHVEIYWWVAVRMTVWSQCEFKWHQNNYPHVTGFEVKLLLLLLFCTVYSYFISLTLKRRDSSQMSEILQVLLDLCTQALCCVKDTLRLHYRINNRYTCSCDRGIKKSTAYLEQEWGLGQNRCSPTLLLCTVQDSGWLHGTDKSGRIDPTEAPPKQSLTSGFEVSLKAPKQRLLHTSIGPGGRAGFLVNVRPKRKTHQEQVQFKKNKNKRTRISRFLRSERHVFSVSTPRIASVHEGRMVAVRGESRGIILVFAVCL